MGGLRVFPLRRDYTADAGFRVYRVLYTVICPSVGHQCLLVETIAQPVLLKWLEARQRSQLTVSVRLLQCTPMPLKHKPDSHGVQMQRGVTSRESPSGNAGPAGEAPSSENTPFIGTYRRFVCRTDNASTRD